MIKISEDAKQHSVSSIKRYFAENLDEEIGDLKALLLLEFILSEVGPSIYNQAITDAQAYLQEKVIDLEGTCYEEEFDYWTDK